MENYGVKNYETEQPKGKGRRRCLCCNKSILWGKFCRECKKNVPYKFFGSDSEKCNEIVRNKNLKKMFRKTRQIGNISFDMVNNIFQIGNEYRKISELSNYGIYEDNYRTKDDVTGFYLVYVDIILAYEIQDQPRRIIKIMTSRCKMKKKGGKYEIISPQELLELEDIMRIMKNSEYKKAVDALNIINYINKN